MFLLFRFNSSHCFFSFAYMYIFKICLLTNDFSQLPNIFRKSKYISFCNPFIHVFTFSRVHIKYKIGATILILSNFHQSSSLFFGALVYFYASFFHLLPPFFPTSNNSVKNDGLSEQTFKILKLKLKWLMKIKT